MEVEERREGDLTGEKGGGELTGKERREGGNRISSCGRVR